MVDGGEVRVRVARGGGEGEDEGSIECKER
jgi:hypothetical protein